LSPSPPPPPPPLSPISSTWASSTASPILPPPSPSPSWDFWDPFVPPSSSSRSAADDDWDDLAAAAAAATSAAAEITSSAASAAAAVAAPPSSVSCYAKGRDAASELAMVVVPKSGGTTGKNLAEIVKELDEYFLKAADAGAHVSFLLEAPNCDFPSTQGLSGKVFSYGKSLNPLVWSKSSNSMCGGFTRISNGGGFGVASATHSSTVEKLYAWERKLYLEVKNYERNKEEHEKRVDLLRKQEIKGVDYVKVEKNRMEIERLESKMLVATQAIETTTAEIIRLRESELFPQLLDLVTGMMGMWRSMYQCHQVQTHIVQQLQYLNNASNPNPTSDLHRQATIQLEIEVERWYSGFCTLINSQRDYINSLTGWLRLSLFQFHHDPLTGTHQNSDIYSLCEEWQLAVDRIPDKVASEGLKSFLIVIRSIVAQQSEEQKEKKRSEAAFKDLEKRADELRSLESKHGPYVANEKRVKVEALKAKAEEEKSKYEKSVGVTRAMTLNNLQTGFPNVFQTMTGFASICMQAFESVYNHRRVSEKILDSKRLLT
ncbi:hypothetical protein ACMD2_06499, partial [Ananas comosus]